MNKYSSGDFSEDIVDILLNSCWNVPRTKINRTKRSDRNNSVQLIKVNGKTFLLPDISVLDEDYDEVILRIEVKSFYELPKKGSPNPNLPLFPIKTRQLFSYAGLQAEEEVGIKIIIAVGYSEFSFHWCTIDELMNDFDSLKSKWNGEDTMWFNLEDLNSDFSNLG